MKEKNNKIRVIAVLVLLSSPITKTKVNKVLIK